MSANEHGKRSTYINHRCRCRECKAAHSAYQKQANLNRAADLAVNPDAATHGKASTYINWMCRCPACTDAHRENMARRRNRGGVGSE